MSRIKSLNHSTFSASLPNAAPAVARRRTSAATDARDARVVRDSRESVEKPASDFGAYEQEEGS